MPAQVFPYPITAHHPAGDAVAIKNDGLADGLTVNHIVKSRHALQLCGRYFQQLGHGRQALVGNPAAVFLHDFQRFYRNGRFIFVTAEFGVDFPDFFRT